MSDVIPLQVVQTERSVLTDAERHAKLSVLQMAESQQRNAFALAQRLRKELGIMADTDSDSERILATKGSKCLSISDVEKFRTEMFEKSMALVRKKGADYNRTQQLEGDTLFNLRVCEMLGVVPRAERGLLVRLTDKLMRLISLEDGDPAVVDESFEDTVADVHNYVDYVALMRRERRMG